MKTMKHALAALGLIGLAMAAAVYAQPAPQVVYVPAAPPVYYAPAPVVSFGFGYHSGPRYYGHAYRGPVYYGHRR